MVEGIVRPKQDRLGDTARERVIPGAGARRRGVRGTGRGRGDAQPVAARRVFDGRHDPPDHQQPDRLHDAAGRIAIDAVFDGHRARRAGADLPCERRQPAGGDPRRADGVRLPAAVQEGRGDRHGLLPAPRPQRGRRPELHAADSVSQDQGTSVGGDAVCASG